MIKIPDYIAKRTDLSANAKILYGFIYSNRSNQYHGRVLEFKNLEEIGNFLGFSARTLYRIKKELTDKDLIVSKKGKIVKIKEFSIIALK